VLTYNKTEIIELKSQIFEQFKVRIFIKREDQNHPLVSGNKWWKLKYNLKKAIESGSKVLLTFGGAYSNHIYATAAAANEMGLKSIGIIRGEEMFPLNPTLAFAKTNGMQLHYVARDVYRYKYDAFFLNQLRDQFGDFYLIPEGGTNEWAVKGCAELACQINEEIHFDYLCLPVGTGGTIAGIAEGLDASKKILGFPSLKGASFLASEIQKLTSKQNWQLIYDYHFGGYAKVPSELMDFMIQFEREHKVPLEPIYTAKMMFGVIDLISQGFFASGSSVLILHTGGLQGRSGFNF